MATRAGYAVVIGTVALLLACGESHAARDAGARDGGARDSGGADAGFGPCPGARPEPGAACAREGLVCEYGTRPCLSSAECTGGSWSVATPRCPPPPSDGCPTSRTAAAGTACPGEEGATCEYDSLVCTCTTCPVEYPLCMPVDPPVWACEAPNPDPACPAAQPLLGTACPEEDRVCDYGCEPGMRRVCVGGVWTRDSAPGGCPASTRRVKRDIEYLDARQVDDIAADVMRTRLSTFEYTDPALSGRRHLGFVIEDQPHAYSVDPERSQVDLYGYASMLVAALQAQQRQIHALEREVAALRAGAAPEAVAQPPRSAR